MRRLSTPLISALIAGCNPSPSITIVGGMCGPNTGSCPAGYLCDADAGVGGTEATSCQVGICESPQVVCPDSVCRMGTLTDPEHCGPTCAPCFSGQICAGGACYDANCGGACAAALCLQGQCVTCVGDAGCGAGEFCNDENQCQAGCATDSDCGPAGGVLGCVDGNCAVIPPVLPLDLAYAAVAVEGDAGLFYVVGGCTDTRSPCDTTVSSVEILHFGDGDAGWTYGPALNVPRAQLGLALLPDGTLWAVGGSLVSPGPDGGELPLPTSEFLRPGARGWWIGPSLNVPRDAFALLVGADGRLYAIGGETRTQAATASVEILDPSVDAGWILAPDFPSALVAPGGFTTGDGVSWVVGGGLGSRLDGGGGSSAEADVASGLTWTAVLAGDGGSWVPGPSFTPVVRQWAGSVALAGSGGVPLDLTDALELLDGGWQQLPESAADPLARGGAVFDAPGGWAAGYLPPPDDAVIVLGGYGGGSTTATHVFVGGQWLP